jgi:transposase
MLPSQGGTISMALIRIASRARQFLQRIIHSSSNAREVRRAQVLLWLHGGERPTQVAKRTGLTRQAIYAIVQRFQGRQGEPVATRIKDRAHPGRPPSKIVSARRVMQELLQQSPQRYHYRAPVWTVPMLQVQVQRRLQRNISRRTIRRALHQLRYRFKRPRYVLALRPTTWRQAKGGSKKS